jgi:CubicO group peptidase (beta-lactamase class C family)
MDESRLDEAIRFAIAHESAWSREVGDGWGIHAQDPPPWNRLFGPIHGRGPISGTVVVDGRSIASWGEPDRADPTFSVAKTYLALLAGVAHDRGLLPEVDEPVGARLRGIGFDAGRNAEITWAHLLQQTSEWEGECFGIPEQVDRNRHVQFQGVTSEGRKGDARPLGPPGTRWEYNDVRINQLSLALLHLFRRALPEVFRDAIMAPLGMPDGWQWVGYDHAWVEIDGRRLPSVPGGSHWGGGVSISAAAQACIGRLLLDDGRWAGRQLLSSEWIARMRTPCAIAPFYGYLVWLNTGRKIFPSLPASSWFAIGAGTSFTWIEPERHMVLVVRWIDADHADEFFSRVIAALD